MIFKIIIVKIQCTYGRENCIGIDWPISIDLSLVWTFLWSLSGRLGPRIRYRKLGFRTSIYFFTMFTCHSNLSNVNSTIFKYFFHFTSFYESLKMAGNLKLLTFLNSVIMSFHRFSSNSKSNQEVFVKFDNWEICSWFHCGSSEYNYSQLFQSFYTTTS